MQANVIYHARNDIVVATRSRRRGDDLNITISLLAFFQLKASSSSSTTQSPTTTMAASQVASASATASKATKKATNTKSAGKSSAPASHPTYADMIHQVGFSAVLLYSVELFFA